MPNQRIQRSVALAGVLCFLPVLAACEVEWGGADLALERPPTPEDTATEPQAEETRAPPVPEGPALYRLRAEEDGGARVSPLALVRGTRLEALPTPEDVPAEWWRRFDSTFLAPGRELDVRHLGVRVGSVVLTGTVEPSSSGCPGVASGRLLLAPGARVPEAAFALSSGLGGAGPPAAPPEAGTTSRQRTFGPILTERLLSEAGVDRHYLAREADLRPVALGDTLPGFAATYLIADSLAPGPPTGRAVSLVFLARAGAGEGYEPVWALVERYESGDAKAAYRYLEPLHLPDARIDLLRRYDGDGSRLAAAWTVDGDRRIGWSAPASRGCPE